MEKQNHVRTKTIAQQLGITEFPFKIKDRNGNIIYLELSNNFWWKSEYSSNGKERHFETSRGYKGRWEHDTDGRLIYYENSCGEIKDNRPKETIIVNGVKYKRMEQ